MTGQEMINWIKENHAENLIITIPGEDEEGFYFKEPKLSFGVNTILNETFITIS